MAGQAQSKIIRPVLSRIQSLPLKHLLALMLATDLFLILLHILRNLPGIDLIPAIEKPPFSISADLGLGESFQYVKELWIALLLGALVIRYGKKAYLGWSLLFGYLLLDDMLGFHEGFGALGEKYFHLPAALQMFPRLRISDLFELGSSAIIGSVVLVLLFVFYRRSAPDVRMTQNVIFVLFALLIGFGVALDFFDRFFSSRMIAELLKLIEDGGEMLVMSLICWYSFVLFERYSTAEPAPTQVE